MLSIVVPWRDRTQLAESLPTLLASARAVNGTVTIVNDGGDRSLLVDQLGRLADQVEVVEVEPQPYFNKSRAQNLGAAHTEHPWLFFCDCDICIEPDVVRQLLAAVRQRPGLFGTLAGVTESKRNSRGADHVVCFGYEMFLRTADGRELRIVDHEEDAADGTRHAPGLLFVRRADFLAVNGYNSGLHGWGWEDQDMISRLTLGAGLERLSQGRCIHLSHDDDDRLANYPIEDRWESRDRMFRRCLANYNRADFQGTYEQDLCAHRTAKRSGDSLVSAGSPCAT